MAKRSHRHTLRSGKNDAGCLWGFISFLDFRQARNTQKLLSDGRHDMIRSVAAEKNSSKYSLLNSHDGKHEDLNCASLNGAGNGVLSRTSIKMLMEREMSEVNQERILHAEPKRCNSRCGAGFEAHISDCNEKNHGKISSWDTDFSALSVPTTLESDKPQLLNLAQTFFDNLDIGALLQEFHDAKHRDQNNCAGYENVDSFQNHFILQKTLKGSLEPLHEFLDGAKCDGALHESEELMKALELLSSNKDMFLKVLKDPNSLLGEHIGHDHQNIAVEKRQISEPCKLPEAVPTTHTDSLNHAEETASQKLFQKPNISEPEKERERNKKIQPPNRIVLLKPSSAGQQSLEEVDSSSAPHRRLGFGLSFQEIKRRLRHATGVSKRNQPLLSAEGVLCRIPKRNELESLSPVDNCRSSSTRMPCQPLTESIIQTQARKQPIDTLDHRDDAEGLCSRQVPKSWEQTLVTDHDLSSPRFSPGRYKDPGLSPRIMRFSPPWSPNEKIYTENCAEPADNLNVEVKEIASDTQYFKSQTNEVPYNGATSSPSYSPGRYKEPGSSPRQVPFFPLWSPSQQNDTSPYCVPSHDSEWSPCTSSNKDAEFKALKLEPDPFDSYVKEDSSIRETLSPEGVVNVVDIGDTELVEAISSDEFDRNKTHDAGEECRHDGSPLWSRLDMAEEKSQSVATCLPLGILQVHNRGAHESIMEKLERRSPISILEPPFLDDMTSPERSKIEDSEHAKLPLLEKEILLEEYDDFNIVLTSSYHEISRRTCMEDDEFKSKYIISLLEASALSNYETWERFQLSDQLLDPSLFDEVEIPAGEIPDDLKLLFDCIGETLETILGRYFHCMPWVASMKPNIHPFPSRENLIQEIWRGTTISHLDSEMPRPLHQIIKKDIDSDTWMDINIEIDDIVADVGREIFKEMMEEIVLESWILS